MSLRHSSFCTIEFPDLANDANSPDGTDVSQV